MERRKFLQSAVPLAILPSILSGFSAKVLGNHPILNALLNTYVESDKVLVMIQLNGGNDGLNMVIPIDQFDNYYRARTNIAIPENKILKLNGHNTVGLHPAMTGLQSLFNNGKVRLIQAVGYPNQNFSHFRSTDIWMSASNSNEQVNSGWMGRYLSDQYPNYPSGYPNESMSDPLGIQIGSTSSLAFQGPSVNMGISISNVNNFYNLINGIQEATPPTPAGNALKHVRLVARQANQYAGRISSAASNVTTQNIYPSGNILADQLKIVARLIKGGLKTRVYMVSMGGFDNHALQTNTNDTTTGNHATLLQRLSDGILAFQNDLKSMGIEDRVIGMTFSEFGRRVRSNASSGTDHGAAAPLFVFGSKANPGITGVNHTIPSNPTVIDNVPMQYDFRSVYASILENWFCVDQVSLETIMLRNYQSLQLCNNPSCKSINNPIISGDNLISNYPNPFTGNTTLNYITNGGHTLIQIMDATGRVIAVPLDREQAAGKYQLNFIGGQLPNGVYYMRLQNGAVQQVKSMLKVQ